MNALSYQSTNTYDGKCSKSLRKLGDSQIEMTPETVVRRFDSWRHKTFAEEMNEDLPQIRINARDTNVNEYFRQFAAYIARVSASPQVLLVVVMLLGLSGWYYDFSKEWEHTTTFVVAIATFLIIFFLQNSQNFGEKVTHLKLDELIRAVEGTRNEVVAAEEKEEHEIDTLREITIQEHKEARIVQEQ